MSKLLLGLPLDKTLQTSDWGVRPLSPGQVRVATLCSMYDLSKLPYFSIDVAVLSFRGSLRE
jgi:hypothetical protein